MGPSTCVHAGVIGPRVLGCNGRRIGPRNRTWWSSSNATAIVDAVGPATAVVEAHVVPDLSGPRPAYWASWSPSSPAVPARDVAGKLVAPVGYGSARWCHQLWARALRVSVLRGSARRCGTDRRVGRGCCGYVRGHGGWENRGWSVCGQDAGRGELRLRLTRDRSWSQVVRHGRHRQP